MRSNRYASWSRYPRGILRGSRRSRTRTSRRHRALAKQDSGWQRTRVSASADRKSLLNARLPDSPCSSGVVFSTSEPTPQPLHLASRKAAANEAAGGGRGNTRGECTRAWGRERERASRRAPGRPGGGLSFSWFLMRRPLSVHSACCCQVGYTLCGNRGMRARTRRFT